MPIKFQNLTTDKKVYLASDFHLGVPDMETSLLRERKIIRWLDSIAENAGLIILVGDIFDFWFEYKHVVPKSHIRFLGKLAELRDRNVDIIFFAGNHDIWMFDYFTQELDIPIYRHAQEFEFFGKRYLIGHGDGLGPGDTKYKIIKHIFINPIAQWFFGWIHPNVGFWAANKWSANSKKKSIDSENLFLGVKEILYQYSTAIESNKHHDFYVFGHRHLPLEMDINGIATYINLGEWLSQCHYLEIDKNETKLLRFEG